MVGWKAEHCLCTLVTEITDNHWHAVLEGKILLCFLENLHFQLFIDLTGNSCS